MLVSCYLVSGQSLAAALLPLYQQSASQMQHIIYILETSEKILISDGDSSHLGIHQDDHDHDHGNILTVSGLYQAVYLVKQLAM